MKFVIVYSSRYGNGKKCVDVVEQQLKTKGHGIQVTNAKDAKPEALPPADMYIFSAASEKFSLQTWMKKYIKNLPEMQGQKYALMSTHGMDRTIGLNKMEKILTVKKKMSLVSKIDFKVEGDVNEGKGLPEGYEGKLKEWINKIV
jgi:menaquinone-dependent protoporphyrinogen IX oxidase